MTGRLGFTGRASRCESRRRERVLFKAVFLLLIVVIVGALVAGMVSKK
ncbi:MAG: hypothetical protein HYS33_00035 [Acidobacteria bacterium]|nr:hypothetical protein [Acidobacteriota bacterium]